MKSGEIEKPYDLAGGAWVWIVLFLLTAPPWESTANNRCSGRGERDLVPTANRPQLVESANQSKYLTIVTPVLDAQQWDRSQVTRFGDHRSKTAGNKKRPKLFSSGRLGSPPPELPNHDWIVGAPHLGVNVTSVTR